MSNNDMSLATPRLRPLRFMDAEPYVLRYLMIMAS